MKLKTPSAAPASPAAPAEDEEELKFHPAVRVGLIGLGVLVAGTLALSMFRSIGAGLSPNPSVKSETSTFTLAEPPKDPEPSPSPSPSVADQSWEDLKAAQANLSSSMGDMERNITRARAQKWLLYAVTECQRLGQPQCQSPRSFLLDSYMGVATEIQNSTRSGQVLTDSETVQKYRDNLALLDDIATAMVLEVTGDVPQPFVTVADINGKIDGFYSAASKFDSLRRVYQQQADESLLPTPQPQTQGAQQ